MIDVHDINVTCIYLWHRTYIEGGHIYIKLVALFANFLVAGHDSPSCQTTRTVRSRHALNYNSSSSVSSLPSSLSAAIGGGCASATLPLLVDIRLANGSARGGGTPLLPVASPFEPRATPELDLSVSDDLALLGGAASSSPSVSGSDCSGVMGSGTSSLSCSSTLAWSISI